MTDTGKHYWPRRALAWDLARGVGALLLVGILLLAVPPYSFGFFGVLCGGVLFAADLADNISRLNTVVEISDTGIKAAGGLSGHREIKWPALERFELRHFKVSRGGWMDLKLRGGGKTILIDDRMNGFASLLERAWAAAQASGVGISDTTHANLVASGLIKPTKA